MSAVVRAAEYKSRNGVLALSPPKDKNGRTSHEVAFNGDADTYATVVLEGGGWFTAKSGFQAGQYGPYSCVTVNDEDEIKGIEEIDAELADILSATPSMWPKRKEPPTRELLEGVDEEGVPYHKKILFADKEEGKYDSRLLCLNYDTDKKTGLPSVTIVDPEGKTIEPHMLPNKNWKKLQLELRSVPRKKPCYFGFSVKCVKIVLDGTEGAPVKRHAELPPDDESPHKKRHADPVLTRSSVTSLDDESFRSRFAQASARSENLIRTRCLVKMVTSLVP